MYKGGKIIASLVVFVALMSLPFFYNIGKSNKGPVINLNTPAIQQLAVKQCVEPVEWMRPNHMKLLSQWREEAVRNGKTVYINSQGKSFENSLQTCVNCHFDPASKESDQFCVSCHTHTAVNPNCWSCHIWPKQAAK
ncbi:sulfate reduction electron transfer complex DsrMKJOP subunit DsrJ [Desulfosporosinus sp. BICA1-9]|uniref:sulfate reduction electron transfer complex DsrMKJOP subunit DsrJ n=1 Tax=Desulfosporosinus sp. BICA1-9 TaxID=1531958 RepID=UPI00054B6E2C|nr:sulfate reduction electron transfer complex DsrMKJOP subunit DsrJ [Desulfosporosinus sp. BICA1-9]KJS77783.1 MAG: menaquinol oxidoreductase [Desulfosporosinus sp. BICA1-9]HBV87895.1 menaquinol oxidoreductase [Desulfosporosinus sp.]